MAELADGDGWQLLIDLAEHLGFDEQAQRFRDALIEEERHVLRVRGWITAALIGEAGASSQRDSGSQAHSRH
jgi:hypothetical protein